MNKALFIHGARQVSVDNFKATDSDEQSVMLDIEAVGVCGSDLHYYKDGGIGGAVIQKSFVPGHEFSGRLTKDVPSLHLDSGELIAVDPATPCHRCEWCIKGYHNLCPKVKFIGAPPFDGAMTNQLAVPLTALVKLPGNMTAEQAAMLEPLGVCIHAIDLAKPKLLESVAVIGCGGIGLGVIQLLKHIGCQSIVAVDPQKHRTVKALELGASIASQSLEEALAHNDKRGCDLVIEATNSPDGFLHAVQAAAIGGRIILIGIPDGDTYTPIEAAEARRRGLDIRFSRRMGDVYPRAIQLVSSGAIDVDTLITHRFNLDDSPQAMQMQADEAPDLIKSMILPNKFSGKPDA